jgi:glucose-1-phosphate thymidylyltransferase
VDASARIEASRLIAPVSIGAGALVANSVVGPNVSLGEGSVARGSLVSETICLPRAQLENVETSGAVVGEGAIVRGQGARRRLRAGSLVADGETINLT